MFIFQTPNCISINGLLFKKKSILRAHGHNITLQLIGGGEGKAQKLLDKSINKYDPEASFVQVIDFISQNKVPEYLSKSNYFYFASSCENMPITLIEGMASGLPIACSDRGPMPEHSKMVVCILTQKIASLLYLL